MAEISLFQHEQTPPSGGKTAGQQALERLATSGRKQLRDWYVLGYELLPAYRELGKKGSFAGWCRENGYDIDVLGTRGKGAIYDACWLAMDENRPLIERVLEGRPEFSNPSHIRYEYNKLEKEDKKLARDAERAKIGEMALELPPSELYEVHHMDMNDYEPTEKFDWIITDPPYPKEFLGCWSDLARNASKWLKPGGMVVAMSGQSYLDDVMRRMGEHLDYYWMGAIFLPGQPTPLRQVNVNTSWKPILMYGDYTGKIFGDAYKSEGNDKDHHMWGQSVSGMSDIITKLCLPGERILDPFCGGGTTGIAAVNHSCFFTGLEIDENNTLISRSRIHDATM